MARQIMKLRTKLLADYYLGGLLHALFKPLTVMAGWLLRRDHDVSQCRQVTFVKLLGGGSLLMAYPALLGLRRQKNIQTMRLVATAATVGFARTMGVFDEIIIIRDGSLGSLLADSLRTLRKLWRTDTVVDLEIHSRLTTIFCLFTAARNRVAFYTANSFWRMGVSTHLLFMNQGTSVFYCYEQLAKLLGAQPAGWPDASRQFAAGLPALDQPAAPGVRIAMAACCSDLSRERMLEPGEWVKIVQQRLPRFDPLPTLYLLGAPGDRDTLDKLAGAIAAACPGLPIVNQAGKFTLDQSLAFLATMNELWCIDSALLHAAQLLGVHTESWWGPTSPVRLLPPGSTEKVHYFGLPCSPCVHIASEVPCKGNNLCMRLAADPDYPCDRNPIWLAQSPQTGKTEMTR